MKRFLLAAVLALCSVLAAQARGGGHGGSHASRAAARCTSCLRDSRGRIARSSKAVREFKKTHPCPKPCKDMVVDHIIPLKRGGSDTPDNMQWMTKAEAAAKDKVE